MDVTYHTYPNAIQGRIRQAATIALIVVMLLAALALVLLAALIGAPLFVIMALLLALLTTPLLMRLAHTSVAAISPEGLRVTTLYGERLIVWEDVRRIRRYPLLPSPEQETGRRLLVGRARYSAAKGIMLTVPSLPLPFRIAGLLAGEGGAPVVVFSNRTHSDYDALVRRVCAFARDAVIVDQHSF
jgi:membrane protein implicated in regulation of membrane protease activity